MLYFKWLYIRLLLSFLLLFAADGVLQAQSVFKYIVDGNRQPVAYAAVYFPESHHVYMSDAAGCVAFQPTDAGQQLSVFADGFETLSTSFSELSADSLIELRRCSRFYPPGMLRANKGKPEKIVIDRLLSKCTQLSSRLKELQATVYLRYIADLENFPSLLKLSKSIRDAADYVEQNRFVQEEVCRVSRDSAGNWHKHLLAMQNSIPKQLELNPTDTYINIYAPAILGKYSPLMKSSKRFYRYRIEYLYDDGGRRMIKIRIAPKKEDDRLMSGFIHVEEGTWKIRRLELNVRQTGGTLLLKALCCDWNNQIPLPVAVSTSKKFSLAGLKVNHENYLTIRYDSVNFSPVRLKKRNQFVEEKGHFYKYQLPLPVERVSAAANPSAVAADSLYWSVQRTIPLSKSERESYRAKYEVLSRSLEPDKIQKPSFVTRLAYYSTNEYIRYSSDSAQFIAFPSLISYVGESNFVDGFWLGAYVRLAHRISKASIIQFKPELYYTTARKTWVGRATVDLHYAPRRLGHLQISGGRVTEDYNGECGASRFFNGMFSTLFAENYIKLYGSDYIQLSNQVEPLHSLMLNTRMKYEHRYVLENHQYKSWFGRSAEPNIPSNRLYSTMPSQQHIVLAASLDYTPSHYYSMEKGRKQYRSSLYPTIGIGYELGASRGGGGWKAPYHRWYASLEQTVSFGFFNHLHYLVSGGLFSNRSSLYFPDMKHFASSELSMRTRSFDTSLNCIDNYYLSTDNRWAEVHISYHSPYLLLKKIPFLQRFPVDEAFHFHRIMVKERLPYTELGYSVGKSEMMRLGLFAGFNGGHFHSIGVRVNWGWLNRLFP